MTFPMYMYGVPEMKKALAAEARRRRMAIVKKISKARRRRNVERIKRTTPYARNSEFVPPPLPAYVLNSERLQYIFYKKLRNSDIDRRIVLPKRPVEDHLPELAEHQCLSLPVIDLDGGDSRVFKFRYWPNNTSRMYVFEDTVPFIKKYKLQTGDYVLMYKDDENSEYFIRAVKASEVEGADKDIADDDSVAAATHATMACTNAHIDSFTHTNSTECMARTDWSYKNDIFNLFMSWDQHIDSFLLTNSAECMDCSHKSYNNDNLEDISNSFMSWDELINSTGWFL